MIRLRRVLVESPYKGNVEANRAYAIEAIRDCLQRGEAPIASHLLYTQPGVLDDGDAAQRELGMLAGWAWTVAAETVVVYIDHGISEGMQKGIDHAHALGIPVEHRRLKAASLP